MNASRWQYLKNLRPSAPRYVHESAAVAMKRVPLPVAPEVSADAEGPNPHENRAMDALIGVVAAAGLACACLIS